MSHQALAFGIGGVVSRGIALLMMPVITRALTPADYGVLQLLDLMFEVVALAAGSRMASGVFRYWGTASSRAERGRLVGSALLMVGGSYVAIGLGAAGLARPLATHFLGNERLTGVVQLGALSFVVQGLGIVPMAAFRIMEMGTFVAWWTVGHSVVQAALNILFLVVLKMGLIGMILSSTIAHAIAAVVVLYVLAVRTGVGFSRNEAKRMYRYGWPLVSTQGAAFITTYGDRFFLQRYFGTTQVGLYAFAYNFAFLVYGLGFVPFASTWEALRFEAAARPDRSKVLSAAFVLSGAMMVCLGTAVCILVGPLLRIAAGRGYWPAERLVPLLVLAYVIQAFAATQDVGIHVGERTKLSALATWFGAGIALAAYMTLIPRLGGWGAAIATLLAIGGRYILVYRFSQRLLPVRYEWAPVLLMLVFGGLAVGASALVPLQPLWSGVLLRSGILVPFLAAVWFVALQASHRQTVIEILRPALAAVHTRFSRATARAAE